MPINTSNKFVKFSFILGGMVFILGGFLEFQNSNYLIAVVQILTGIVSLILLKQLNKENTARLIYLASYFLNFLVGILVAFHYIEAGKQYIQYPWFVVAAFSLIAMIVFWYKTNLKKSS